MPAPILSVLRTPLAAVLAAMLSHISVAQAGDGATAGPRGAEENTAAHTLTVSAAISLSDAMKEIAAEYERRHPGSSIQLNVGGSGSLLRQIEKGAPVDVFASADELTMDSAQEKGLVVPETRRVLATNTLVLIQPLGAPSSEAPAGHSTLSATSPIPAASPIPATHTLADLQRPDIRRIAIGNPDSVPAGRYARTALQEAALWEPLQSKLIPAQNVRQVLEYVARGEVDAGFVYGSDASIMRHRVQIALTVPIQARYPVAVMRDSRQQAQAGRLIELMMSPFGQKVLADHGFLTEAPPARD